MTLMNGFAHAREARIYTDCAWLAMPEARIIAFKPKTFVGLNWPFVVATSYLSEAQWLDRTVQRVGVANPPELGDVLDILGDELSQFQHENPNSRADMLVAGYDRFERCCRLFCISSIDKAQAPACQPTELTAYTSSGTETAAWERGNRIGWNRKRMLAVIDEQRKSRVESPPFGEVYSIGGTAVEVKVTEQGTSTRVVRHWNDALGAPIRPSGRQAYGI